MKKYKWNIKKFLENMAILAGVVGLMVLCVAIVKDFGKSPTIQYRQHLEAGGTWQEWAENK